jgi:membrane protein DedA with SNARE-associated domain
VEHGYLLIFAWIFLDQVGVPVPAIPVLMTVGAVAGRGQLDLGPLLIASTAGAIPADLLWYESGRRRGHSVLRTLCRISLEPDSCVRNTEDTFVRYGKRSLLLAKFIPGYQTLAPPLAGMSGMRLGSFLLYDIPGAMLWSAAFLGLGFAFHGQIDHVYQLASELGWWLLVLLAGGLAGYMLWKGVHRRRFLRSLRIARIEPHELNKLLNTPESPDALAIFDLRSALSIEMEPCRIPGAKVMDLEELDARHDEIPRGREVIIYCN